MTAKPLESPLAAPYAAVLRLPAGFVDGGSSCSCANPEVTQTLDFSKPVRPPPDALRMLSRFMVRRSGAVLQQYKNGNSCATAEVKQHNYSATQRLFLA